MGVCRHWQDTIAAAPYLWSSLSLSHRNTQFVELCIVRSQDAPLSISLRVDDAFVGRGEGNELSWVLDLITLHRSRLADVNIHLDSRRTPEIRPALDRLAHLLQSSLPRLTAISLARTTDGIVPDGLLKLDPLCHPAMRRVELAGIEFGRHGLQISQLTTLVLRNIDKGYLVLGVVTSVASLLDILEACVQLRYFTYEKWQNIQRKPVDPSRIVSLPEMRRFHVLGYLADIGRIMPHISLPRQAALLLDVSRYNLANPSPLGAILPRRSTHSAALDEVDVVKVHHHNHELHVVAFSRCTYDGEVALRLAYPYTTSYGDDIILLYNILRGFGHLFPSSLQVLIFDTDVERITLEDWSLVLRTFPGLTGLNVHDISRTPKQFLFAIASALEPTPTGVPCCHLQKLRLTYAPQKVKRSLKMLRALQIALQKRAEAGYRLPNLRLEFKQQADDGHTVNDALQSSAKFLRLQRGFETSTGSVTIIWGD
ncbi:uncharacterized protein C8Q71DRAFT_851848 [Rhodofomes roseus]|uniref:F-box domain-containing protein n=1 Tax=Rhodofomes roseus TaxID=34475 RepID=A0ABQ8JY71_9APHY|nr:uncharacterized protein C8Q71DRAFT_851848 [Rhodofomes roseus]KAH9829197.1 hypothetical protein C8Q71DRAFT_851848 [Rhodofomes roseus]